MLIYIAIIVNLPSLFCFLRIFLLSILNFLIKSDYKLAFLNVLLLRSTYLNNHEKPNRDYGLINLFNMKYSLKSKSLVTKIIKYLQARFTLNRLC